MPEHHDPEKLDVFGRPEDIVAWRSVVIGGGEDDEGQFPNGGPLDVLGSGEQGERSSGEKKITALR
jgi:hypothetical protein